MPRPSDRPPTPSSGEIARDAVEEILEKHGTSSADATRERASTPRSGGGRTMMLLVAVGVGAWVWLAPPAWLQPEAPPEPTPAEMEAGLRMDMYVAALSVDRFRSEQGRLPHTLEAAVEDPGDAEDLIYQRISRDTYRLTGSRGTHVVSWTSDRPVRDLIGTARAVIEGTAEEDTP